ncbi:MAG: F0F1 ATP synthase subunit epsilon [Candidatus Paceibacterota bacterium]
MQTKVVTLSGVVFEGEAKAVHARTQSGDITLLDHHRPLISVLAPQTRIRIETLEGTDVAFPAANGFLHMDGNNVLTILVD